MFFTVIYSQVGHQLKHPPPFRLSAITFILTLSTFFTVIYSQVGKIPTLELLHGSEAFPSCN